MLIGVSVNIWTEKIQPVLSWALPMFHCSQISDRWWHRLASIGCHEALNQEPGKRVTEQDMVVISLQQTDMQKVKWAQVRSSKV